MTGDVLNLSGLWTGSFAYPGNRAPTTPFLASLTDEGGQLSGSTIEPNTIGISSEELEAVIHGTRQGRSVDFIKTYDGASDAAHSVDYVGQVSDDGNRVTGVWSLGHMDGTFEMAREGVREEALGEKVEAVELDR